MGGVIHQSEGFYFRHDSVKNPLFERNFKKFGKKNSTDLIFSSDKTKLNDLEKTVIDKFQFQWKTSRKAFIDLSKEKTGAIMPVEFNNYLKHWGLYLTEAQFKQIFEKFDQDKDGRINYTDFQNTVGKDINPPENLYFRQDIRRVPRPHKCEEEDCWQQPSALTPYCNMHVEIHRNNAYRLLVHLALRLKNKWDHFTRYIKKHVDKEDPNIIKLSQFVRILKTIYHVELKPDDIEMLRRGLGVKATASHDWINISKIFSIRNTMTLKDIYRQLDLTEEEKEDGEFVDASGYYGEFYRQKETLEPCSLGELAACFKRKNRLHPMMRCIKQIDKDRNGFVTN